MSVADIILHLPLLEFANTSRRQAFFYKFSRRALKAIQSLPIHKAPLVLLTGSLRGRSSMASAIRNQHADLVGSGRPSVVCPSLPTYVLDEQVEDKEIPEIVEPILPLFFIPQLVGASIRTMWYCYEMARIAASKGRGYTPSNTWAWWRVIYCYLYALLLRLFIGFRLGSI